MTVYASPVGIKSEKFDIDVIDKDMKVSCHKFQSLNEQVDCIAVYATASGLTLLQVVRGVGCVAMGKGRLISQ